MKLSGLLHGVIARLSDDGAGGHSPDLFGFLAMFGIGHDQVGRKPVRKGADFARGAAGGRLAGKRERAIAGCGDLAGEQMNVIDHVVGPHAACVLVETHGPETRHLDVGIGVQLGQLLQPRFVDAGMLHRVLERVRFDEFGKLVEGDLLSASRIIGMLGALLQRVVRAQAVTDVGVAAHVAHVLADEILIDTSAADDCVGNVVEDDQVGLRLEHDWNIGQIERAVLIGG
jgi:hypothetical protein